MSLSDIGLGDRAEETMYADVFRYFTLVVARWRIV